MQSLNLLILGIALSAGFICAQPVNANNNQGQSWTSDDLTEVEDGQFRCPESLTTLMEKTREIQQFLVWTRRHHPDWDTETVLSFRLAVLESKECKTTLSNIKR